MKCHYRRVKQDMFRCINCGHVAHTAGRPQTDKHECTNPPERKERRRQNIAACVHRGEKLRLVDCELCGRKGQTEQVYQCEIHGECTVRKFKSASGIQSCLSCENYSDGGA